MGVPHRPYDLRRVPSDLTVSVQNTDTNSTSSSVYGPGQPIGALFSAGGKRLEALVSRAAERLGYGPNAAVQRLLGAVRAAHARACRPASRYARVSTAGAGPPTLDTAALVDEIADLASTLCPVCHRPFLAGVPLPPDVVDGLQKLLAFMRKTNASACYLAARYLQVLAMADEGVRLLLLRSAAVPVLEEAVAHARIVGWGDPVWSYVEAPATDALRAMRAPCSWASLFDLMADGEGTAERRYVQLTADIAALADHAREADMFGLLQVRRLTTLLDALLVMAKDAQVTMSHKRRTVFAVLSALLESLDATAVNACWARYEDSRPHRDYLRVLYDLKETAQYVALDSNAVWQAIWSLYEPALDWLYPRYAELEDQEPAVRWLHGVVDLYLPFEKVFHEAICTLAADICKSESSLTRLSTILCACAGAATTRDQNATICSRLSGNLVPQQISFIWTKRRRSSCHRRFLDVLYDFCVADGSELSCGLWEWECLWLPLLKWGCDSVSRRKTIDDDAVACLQRLRSAVTATPLLEASTKAKLQALHDRVHALDDGESNVLEMLRDILYGVISCPRTLQLQSSGADLSESVSDLLAQVRIAKIGRAGFEQDLAARRIAHILRSGLRARSHHTMNAFLVISSQSVFDWWLKADSPAFACLLETLYEAVKLWGWELPMNAQIWDAFRDWQWASLWVPAARVLVHRSRNTRLVASVMDKLHAVASAPGLGFSMARHEAETVRILAQLEFLAEHLAFSRTFDRVDGWLEGDLEEQGPPRLPTVYPLRRLSSLLERYRDVLLLGRFELLWQVHPCHWRIMDPTIPRGLPAAVMTHLCAQLLEAVAAASHSESVVWAIASRDPSCLSEFLRLAEARAVSHPRLASLTRNLYALFSAPAIPHCTGIHVHADNVGWSHDVHGYEVHQFDRETGSSMSLLHATRGSLCWVQLDSQSESADQLEACPYEVLRVFDGRPLARLICCVLPCRKAVIRVFCAHQAEARAQELRAAGESIYVLARRRLAHHNVFWKTGDGLCVDAVTGLSCFPERLPGCKPCTRTSCTDLKL